jgi:hypothetical protein
MILVDSVYVIALVNERDQHHARAIELSEQFDGSPLLITDGILLEIGNSLSRRFRLEAITAIEKLTSYPEMTRVHITSDLFERSFELFRSRRDKAWGLVDCISFVVMRDFGVVEALTHDEHFVQAGFRALLREGA